MRQLILLVAGLALLWPVDSLRAELVRYEFVAGESQLTIRGGFIGINETYLIDGSLVIDIDQAAGTALFSEVDATIQSIGGTFDGASLDSQLQMTRMTGEVVDIQTYSFSLLDNGLLTTIEMTKMPESWTIVGSNEVECCDMFSYQLDAVLVPEPSNIVIASSMILCLLLRFGLNHRVRAQ